MKNRHLQYWLRVTLFAAVLLLMTFTGLGYIKTPILNVTILTVPIAVAAITLGPLAGAILGLVFGLTSAWSAVSGSGGMTTLLFGYHAVGTLFLCIVPRVLVGWVCGLIYKGMKKLCGSNVFSVCVGALSAPLLNCVFFMGTLILMFSSTPVFAEIAGAKSAWMFVWGVFLSNGITEIIVCGIVGTAVAKALLLYLKQR